MPHLPAAILILADRPHPEKQEALALAAAAAERLRIIALCHHWQDCLSLILTRHIGVVVSALDPGDDCRQAVETAGGRLVVARESTSRIRRSVDALVGRLARRGMLPQDIAEVLEVPTREVRRALARLPPGQRPPDSTRPLE